MAPNLIVNGGFEDGLTGWDDIGQIPAVVADYAALAEGLGLVLSSWTLHSHDGDTPISTVVRQTATPAPGSMVLFSMLVKLVGGSGSVSAVAVEDGVGTVVATLDASDATGDAQPLVSFYTPQGNTVALTLRADGGGQWYADSVSFAPPEQPLSTEAQMAFDRETAIAALFERLKSISGIKVASRRLRSIEDVEPEDQPALFISQGPQTPTQQRGQPAKWAVNLDVWLYLRAEEGTDVPPGTPINNLITAIEAALEYQSGEGILSGAPFPDLQNQFSTTLGGLVSHCWISGAVEIDEGLSDSQSIVRIPVELMATA